MGQLARQSVLNEHIFGERAKRARHSLTCSIELRIGMYIYIRKKTFNNKCKKMDLGLLEKVRKQESL